MVRGLTPPAIYCRRYAALYAAALVYLFCLPAPAPADDDLETLEQKALTAAVERVAPSVVRIETVGGLERVQKLLFGTGPTTGLVVDPQGYVVSSAFNFVNKPASILVRLNDGTRKPAKLVATDHSRQIVLLKIEVDRPLPVPAAAPQAEMRVGQWCAAVGRTFEGGRPNLSIGILSALSRVWGKAIQTDAAVSPNNYGGPLVDIHGRVLGVLVPLSPQSAEEIAGVEWYDSGIGFAVPLEHILKMLPKLKQGKDLTAGVAGFNLGAKSLYTDDSVLAANRPNSPADKAGFKAGDRIVEIDGRKITRAAEAKEMISRRYAGEKINVTAMRGQERIQREVELVAKLDAYQHPFLGVLPLRVPGEKAGVRVRYVYPQGPAAAAKIEPGDLITALAGKPVKNRDELLQQMAAFEAGQEAEFEVRHGEAARKVKIKLDSLPEALPPEQLPAAHAEVKPAGGARPAVGIIPLRVAEFKNEVWAYVPEGYDAAAPCGVVVWLHGAAVPDQKQMLALWKPLCDRYDLVLVVPKAATGAWQPDEAPLVEKLVRQVGEGYATDPARVVVCGRETGGAFAYLAAFRGRETIRAVAAVDAAVMLPPPENDPAHRLAVYSAVAKNSRQAKLIEMFQKRLRDLKVPVTQKELGAEPRDLTAEETAELVRWIDMLDRI